MSDDIEDICVIINAGLDGCTSSSLVPRTASSTLTTLSILDKCLYPPEELANEIKNTINNIVPSEKTSLKIINLTLHDYDWLKENIVANVFIQNVLGNLWELTCDNCNISIDYRKTKIKNCPRCNSKLKTEVKLLGDSLDIEDMKNLLWNMSSCDQIKLLEKSPE